MNSTSSLQSRLQVLRQTGTRQFNEEQFIPALSTFQQILAIAQETETLADHIDALHKIGLIHYALKHYSWSLHCLKKILKLANPDSIKAATVCNDISRVYCATKQYSQALRYSAQALEIFLEISHLNGVGITLNYLGEIYNHLGTFEQTLQCCRKALMIFQDINETLGEDSLKGSIYEAAALHNLGIAEYHLDRPRQALAFLNQALSIRKKLCLACKTESKGSRSCPEKSTKIHSELAKTLGQIGIVYFSLKQYNTAIEYYQKALKIYRSNNQQEEQAKIMNYMGLACYKNSNVSYALWYHLKAFELFEEIYEAQSNPNYLPHILSVYQRFNLSDQGVKLYRRVQELSRIMGTEVG